ncbi:MAG TPA: hypothetical protein VKR22_02995 [Acidimicrobiales bacterium]|nr:hypothetical protein [Acidimicrobiales bacterium]
MLALFVTLAAVGVFFMVVAWFLLGFQLGGSHWQGRLLETQLETAKARRQLYDLTRQAFVAMADHALRSREGGGPG